MITRTNTQNSEKKECCTNNIKLYLISLAGSINDNSSEFDDLFDYDLLVCV